MPVMHEVWQFWLVQHDQTEDIMPVMPEVQEFLAGTA